MTTDGEIGICASLPDSKMSAHLDCDGHIGICLSEAVHLGKLLRLANKNMKIFGLHKASVGYCFEFYAQRSENGRSRATRKDLSDNILVAETFLRLAENDLTREEHCDGMSMYVRY